ncbi:MAG: hypothetical protein UY18_C0046G0007 [Microgenomates group bacterium GW2011_GWF2_47_9]|nr:MAG: hypothetical protein UY18_C0046G0007 [Microgenomates group bacterium GW2011_GWF2_47_9]
MRAEARNRLSQAGTRGALSMISRAASISPTFLRMALVIVYLGI